MFALWYLIPTSSHRAFPQIGEFARATGSAETKCQVRARGGGKILTNKLAAWLVASLATTAAVASGHSHASVGGYVVRNGDNDWGIAHRLHVSQHRLHMANPDVKWASIQPRQHLIISAGSSAHVTIVASKPSAKKAVHGGGTYIVRGDDNDWTISAKLGIANKVLRQLN